MDAALVICLITFLFVFVVQVCAVIYQSHICHYVPLFIKDEKVFCYEE